MNPNSSLLDRAGLDRAKVGKLLDRGLEGADDGELFLEYTQSEMLVFDNNRLKQATYDTSQGFGLRAVKDEAVGYAHASDVSEAAIARAADAVRAVKGGHSGTYAEPPAAPTASSTATTIRWPRRPSSAKVKLLEDDRRLCPRQGPARAPGQREPRRVLAGGRDPAAGRRDLPRHPAAGPGQRVGGGGLGDRQESGIFGDGGRDGYQRFIDPADLEARRRRGAAPGAGQSRLRSPRRPARWTWCSAPAGRASCCTRPSATASRATSTARRPRPSPA